MQNCTFDHTNTSSILSKRCDCSFPLGVCYLANLGGLCSTAMWFLVLLPQVILCARKRSVEGVSGLWAIVNFTAALNNAFFVFKIATLPLYSFASAVYMPVLEGILLIEFLLFTKRSKVKIVVSIVATICWIAIVALQVSLDVYKELEWLSITLWSIETFPQIFLNMHRQSTRGLSNMMVLITTVGKTTDFLGPYLLIMPLQYVVMAFFSSSVAIFGTIQVLYYWGRSPLDTTPITSEGPSSYRTCEDDLTKKSPSDESRDTWRPMRYAAMLLLVAELSTFAVAIVWRTRDWLFVLCPVGTYLVIAGGWVFLKVKGRHGTLKIED